ncbi:MAG TPA: hypothetical protein PK037_01420 [Saprospiraceae bacterium]|nr:hypothetical protein [Saprospiraceae bacterium]
MLVQFTQDGYNLAFQDEKNIKRSHFTPLVGKFTRGKIYIVYAISIGSEIHVYLNSEFHIEYNVLPYPLKYFKIVMPFLPCFFTKGREKTIKWWRSNIIYTFKEWATDDYFWEHLIDSSDKEKAILYNYKKLLENEYYNFINGGEIENYQEILELSKKLNISPLHFCHRCKNIEPGIVNIYSYMCQNCGLTTVVKG